MANELIEATHAVATLGSSSTVITTALFPNSPSVPIATPLTSIVDTSFQWAERWGAQFGQDLVSGKVLWAYVKAYSNVPISVWVQFAFAHFIRILCIWSLMSLGLWCYRRTPKAVVDLVAELYASTFIYSLFVFGIYYYPAFTIAMSTIALAIHGASKLWKPVMDEIARTLALLIGNQVQAEAQAPAPAPAPAQ